MIIFQFLAVDFYCRQLSAELLIIIGRLVDNYRQNCRQLSATDFMPVKSQTDKDEKEKRTL
ncbi:hypothetical protein LJC43_00085 [Parabacteroides sp. OttesenSCG-928-G21]|nr:hypothetical protein [Parabacteroides sp. OttesenSCG-928-G21]